MENELLTKKNYTIQLQSWIAGIILCAGLAFLGIVNDETNFYSNYLDSTTQQWLVLFFNGMIFWSVNLWIPYFIKPSHRTFIKRCQRFTFNFMTLCFVTLFFALIAREQLLEVSRFEYAFLQFIRNVFLLIIIISIQYSMTSYQKSETLKLQNTALETANLRAQLNVLKNQVNPNFLFDSLSSLRLMIREDHQDTEEFVLKLAKLYRQLLLNSELETTVLHQEIKFTEDYIFLLKTRYGNNLIFKKDVFPESLHHEVPAFIFYIFLANCVDNNVISNTHPLTVRIMQEEEDAIIFEYNRRPLLIGKEEKDINVDSLNDFYELYGIEDGIVCEETDGFLRICIQLLPQHLDLVQITT